MPQRLRCAALPFLLCLAALAFRPLSTAAQAQPESDREAMPAVFLDCDRCDFSYTRQEIPFVNWVRDREDAVVHLLINSTQTGSGGRKYVLDFIGLKRFSSTAETLTYIVPPDFTWEEERSGLTGIIKIGVLPYLSDSPLLSRMRVSYEEDETDESVPGVFHDPWNSWVFEIEGGVWGEKKATQEEISLDASLRADRVTEAWRIRNRLYGRYNREIFDNAANKITSVSHRRSFWSSMVKSLSPHWSAGLEAEASSSTYSNTNLSLTLGPAVEYSFFDYSEVQRRRLTVAYRVGLEQVDYRERTVYNQLTESLLDESLRMDLDLNQPWGSVRMRLTGSHYFHDLDRYKLDLFSRLSIRLTRGLALSLRGSAERIHDQLHLPAGSATLEEILLRQRDLETTYVLSFHIGLSYTFGAIYNNVVNTRL